MFTHHDTRNNHIHIETSRVGQNARKIHDRFEEIRSQRILLGRHKGEYFRKASDKRLFYRLSSIPQFMLYMEGQGYKERRKGESLEFFKHGTMQGSVPVSVVATKIADYLIDPAEMGNIRGMIQRESRGRDTSLQNQGRKKNGGNPDWQSELTRHMHLKYGLEFVFFTGKGHQRPYGYAVIDHAKKTVFKVVDVLSMGELTGKNPIEGRGFYHSGKALGREGTELHKVQRRIRSRREHP